MIILAPEAILAACIECTLRSSSKIFGEIISGRTRFTNKRFMLDDIVYQNASMFAILLEKENPNSFFSFFILSNFQFLTVDALPDHGLCLIQSCLK